MAARCANRQTRKCNWGRLAIRCSRLCCKLEVPTCLDGLKTCMPLATRNSDRPTQHCHRGANLGQTPGRGRPGARQHLPNKLTRFQRTLGRHAAMEPSQPAPLNMHAIVVSHPGHHLLENWLGLTRWPRWSPTWHGAQQRTFVRRVVPNAAHCQRSSSGGHNDGRGSMVV